MADRADQIRQIEAAVEGVEAPGAVAGEDQAVAGDPHQIKALQCLLQGLQQ